MRSRPVAILVTGSALIACVVLATLWAQARRRSAHLAAELAEIRHVADAGNRHTDTPAASAPATATAETPTTADSDLEARMVLLADARAIPELARREAALVAVRRIKAQHEAIPPPPRTLPPPFGAKYGGIFTELLSDPQYLVLLREDWQAGTGSSRIQRLDKLGVSEDTKRQVLEIEFDSYLASAESGAYTTPEERQAAMQERMRIQKENLARIRQLLGDEGLQRYATATPPGAVTPASPAPGEAAAMMARSEVASGPLAARLSYSEAPLTETDKERLQALLSVMATPKTPAYRLWYDVEFFKQAQSILNPTQLEALRQLQEENEARTLRSRLPKSSELPRTTRRARLEAGK